MRKHEKWMVLLVVLAAASLFVGVHDLSPRELFAGDREAWEVF